MSIPAAIATLFPPAVRERWGEAIRDEIAAAGPRSWPNSVLEASRLWLHPTDWPGHADSRCRRTLLLALLSVTAATVLLVRAAALPADTLPASSRDPFGTLWLVLFAAGLLVAAPLPRRLAELRPAARAAARTLAAPAAAIVILMLIARTPVASHAAPPVHIAMVTWYWITLTFAAVRIVRLLGRLLTCWTPPPILRIALSLGLLASALAVTAVRVLVIAPARPLPLAAAVWLGAAAAVVGASAADLLGRR